MARSEGETTKRGRKTIKHHVRGSVRQKVNGNGDVCSVFEPVKMEQSVDVMVEHYGLSS